MKVVSSIVNGQVDEIFGEHNERSLNQCAYRRATAQQRCGQKSVENRKILHNHEKFYFMTEDDLIDMLQ